MISHGFELKKREPWDIVSHSVSIKWHKTQWLWYNSTLIIYMYWIFFFFFFERINLDYMFRQRIPLFPWWLQATHCARISQKVLIYFHSVPDVILTHNGQVLVEHFSSYAPMCFISRNSHTQKKLLKSKPGRFVFQA